MQALLLLLLAAGALAAPFSFEVRTKEECKKTTRFQYGKEFTYNYVGETVSSVNGSSSAQSALKIEARCIIKTVNKCQHVLKIDSVELWEGQSKNLSLEYQLSRETLAFARELQAHELHFKSNLGIITDVSPEDGESTQALNIKKGILSALQVRFVRDNTVLEEIDVTGKCPVQYRVHSLHLSGRLKVVSKRRNLAECSDRSRTDLGIHIHHYKEKSINLLSSISNCRYMLNSKRQVQKVVCKEEHLFKPFSSGVSAGATTTTRQVLELQGVNRVPSKEGLDLYERKFVPLTYEHADPAPDSLDTIKVEKIITQLARDTMEETKPESARLFSRLVFSLRKLRTKAVEKIWERVFDCVNSELCKKEEEDSFQMYLLDALPHCGTSGCAKVMSRAIKDELVNGERGNLFLTGIALVSVPTADMIEHVYNLCKSKPSRTGMLTLGTLLHKFCEETNCDDLDYGSPITQAVDWLKNRLGDKCDFDTPEEAEEIIMALKAIGNAGRPVSSQSIILECALNSKLTRNMTIAAFDALRRMPCKTKTSEKLLNVYGNSQIDVETRIASYMALLKCPTVELFQRIAKIQTKEVNKQVGSFVWSHITNAMESTEPVHGRPLAEIIRKSLGKNILKEFNMNRLRFSRAWEGSYYSDLLRSGGSFQGHVIYHPNSYFPRSTHVNLTVDVLGASINVLEAAARFEGFEILLEQFFGPGGYYPDNRVMEMFNLRPHEEKGGTENHIKVQVRGKRSVMDDINRVESSLNSLNEEMDTLKHAPSGDVSLKVFGNEMRVASFDDINWLGTEADSVNMVDKLIKLARGGEKTFSKSFMFLDVETTVPTILGLPLKLDAKGTTVVSLKMKGKMDIRNMFWGPMAFDVRGNLKPSAVVEVTGRMGVSAIFAEAGILVNTSMYTATEIKGNATYKQGQTLKFEIGAPSKTVQIFNVSSSLFATLNDEELEIQGTERRLQPAPCLNFTRVLGIAICGRVSVPIGFRDLQSPFFPLSGPASFSLSVLPTDPKLRLYQIVAKRLPTDDESNYDIIARISTPGATWEREFETNASLWLENQEKSISISTGALGYKFGNLSASYNNYTNAVNVTFQARDLVYNNPIALNAQYFNVTNPITLQRKVGTVWLAMYKNYTITQRTEVYNKSRTYGFISNTTYWPGKSIFANAEVSIPSKSINFIANHTCTKTSLRFKGQLDDEENTFMFNVSNSIQNVSLEVTGAMNKMNKEAILKTSVLPYGQFFTVRSSYVARDSEKGLHFKASHDNKNRVFAWYTGIMNYTTEKSIKTNATILGKPFQAIWTYFNYTTEKGFKFNGTAMSKSVDSTVTYLVKDGLKSIKVNASGFNKKAEAVWSYLSSALRKSVNFNANILNKSIEAEWAFINQTNIKSLSFNGTGLNKTVQAAWTFLNLPSDKVVKFNASALNKTIEAFWSYATVARERSIKFNASALNKTIQSAMTFLNLREEKIIKLNATVLNKSLEAVWCLFNYTTEKGLKFSAKVLNKSVSSTLRYIHLPNTKALKFDATVLNKTVEASWGYLNRGNEKLVKFNATVMNKTIEALWTHFNFASEKGLRFKAQAMNKTVEGVWGYFNTLSEKGLKFNATILRKTVNASLAYFKLIDNIGVRFNASAFNRSIGMVSKMLMQGNDKRFVFSSNYQNYTIALTAALKNDTLLKSLCVHPELLGRSYGQVCTTFSNSPLDKSIAFNLSVLNRTGQVKAQRYEEPNFCAIQLTAAYNKKVLAESWLSNAHTDLTRVLSVNATIASKSIDARIYMEKNPVKSERVIGFNLTALNRTMGWKSILVNQVSFKEASIHLMWNKTYVASTLLVFHNLTNEKIFKLRNRIGPYAAVLKGEYRVREDGARREFELVHLLRNRTKMMFYDSSLMTYRRRNSKQRELNFVYTLSVLGRSFAYGWDMSHTNSSSDAILHHQVKTALMYSRGKKVSLTATIKNDEKEFSKVYVVEYLPGKTVQHGIVWYKQDKRVVTTVEPLPRMKLRHELEWNNEDGFFVRSTTSAFNKNMVSYFRYSKNSERYDGRIEFYPTKLIAFNGIFSRENGLMITSNINAFKKSWSHKLEIDRPLRKFFISIELIPQKPVTFQANWDLVDGLKIKTQMTALKKSLEWSAFYENITKTLTSDFTILKEKVLFLQNFDRNTKTLNVSVKIRNRRIGFVGRFDLKEHVVSAHLTCNDYMTGWFLKLDPQERNIIYNATLTSRLSGQVVAEMPNNRILQVTFQRKIGENVVNESRVMYKLNPEASHFMLTWNTTTVNYIASKVQSLKPLLINETMKLYNLTLNTVKNITKKMDFTTLKNLHNKIKQHVTKLHLTVKNYNYKGLYNNASLIAKNISIKALNFSMKGYNFTLKTLAKTINDLPMMARNATLLYKKIRAELVRVKSELMAKVPMITNVVSKHLKNISRDLQSWGSNVSMMVGDIKIRNTKISEMVKRYTKMLVEVQQQLTKNFTVQVKKLVEKVRRMEIRQKNIGALVDKYMQELRDFTCDFNTTCTFNKIGESSLKIYRNLLSRKIRNKTIQQHFNSMKDKATKLSVVTKNLSKKVVKLTPEFLRNTTIKVIQLARNLSREFKNLTAIFTKRFTLAVVKASQKVQKFAKPLNTLIIKVTVSIYNRTKPRILAAIEQFEPTVEYYKSVVDKVLKFNKPMFLPFEPLVKDIMYQILNITIKNIPIGVALDKTLQSTIEEAVKLFKEFNHTVTTNATAIVKFVTELQMKSPEEIIDLTIIRVFKLVNQTKDLVNKTIQYTFNSSKKAFGIYKEKMTALNAKLQKILDMRPEDLVELSIEKIKVYISNATEFVKNVSSEIQIIAKQIHKLDFGTPSKTLWKEIDLVNRYKSLALGEQWNKKIDEYTRRLNSLNLRKRVQDIQLRAENYSAGFVKEIVAVAKHGERAFNLIMKLLRMNVTREEFVKELLSVIESSKGLAKKHFQMAKHATIALYTVHNTYWENAILSAHGYKNITLDKLKKNYRDIVEYIVKFSKEHEQEARYAYEFYRDVAIDVYTVGEIEALKLQEKVTEKITAMKVKLVVHLESLVAELRRYENMTYEEMGSKVYQLSKKFGSALYKNYSVKVLKLYNDTKNLTLRTFNLTRNMAIKYYNLSRIHAATIFKNTKNFTIVYFKIYRNKTIKAFYMSRNMTIKLFNTTRNLTIRGIEYLNKTAKPKLILYCGKCKVMAIKAYEQGKDIAKKAVGDVKLWYADNKEKTMEELYDEAYGAAKYQVDNIVKNLTSKARELQAKIQKKMVIVNETFQVITFEVVSVFNQTKDVSVIAGKQLVAIFLPYGRIVQNKTMIVFLQVKNVTIPLMKKVRNLTVENIMRVKNLTILNLNKAKNFTIEFYRNVTNHKDFKAFVAKHQIKERYAMMLLKANETIKKIKTFVLETRPKVEAKYREVFFYLNVTLPKMIIEKKEEIMANPKEYMNKIYLNALGKVQEAIKDTIVEEIVLHEIWSEYLEEIKQHEIVGVSKDLSEYGKLKANQTLEIAKKIAKEKYEILKVKIGKLMVKVEELKIKAMKKFNDTKIAVRQSFEDFKKMKLKEFIEHRYVFKTIDLAKNTSLKLQTITLQAKNITLKWVGIGKVFYKNMTLKVKNYYTLVIEKHVVALKKNCTVVFEKVKLIAMNYTMTAKNVSIKAWKIASNWTLVQVNATRMWMNKTAEKGIKLYQQKLLPYYKNKVVPFYQNKVVPMCLKCKKLAIEMHKNVTKLIKDAYNRTINSKPYKLTVNFTVKSYNFTVELLRNASKTTPLETALKMKKIYFVAYNFTIKTASKAVNISVLAYREGLKKMNVTQGLVVKLLNDTLKTTSLAVKRIIPALNFTKNEIIETMVFLNKYYGVEHYLRYRVNYHYKELKNYTKLCKYHYGKLHKEYLRLQNESDKFIQEKVPELLRRSAFGTLDFVNKTIRFVNRTFVGLNQTMRSTVQKMNHTIRNTITKIRNAIPYYIRIKNGEVVIVIPHPKRISGDIVSICNEACNKVKNLPQTAKNLTLQALNMTKMYALKAFNISKSWKVAALNSKLYQKLQKRTLMLIDMTRNHPIAKKYFNKTIFFLNITRKYIHDANLTGLVLRAKNHPLLKKYLSSTMAFYNVTRKYIREFNLTSMALRTKNHPLVKKFLNSTMAFYNATRKYIRELNFTRMALRTKNHPLVKQYLSATIHYLNTTRKFFRELNLTKIANMTKSYAPIALKMTTEMCKAGFNATRFYTIKVTNICLNITRDLYNSTSPMHALKKAQNYTMKAFNGTMKHYRFYLAKATARYLNVTKVVKMYKALAVRRATIFSLKLLNMTKNNPITQRYLNSTIHFYNITRKFIGQVNFTKIANLTKTYVPLAFNMTRDMCKVGAKAARNFTMRVANLAWNVTADICNSTSLREAFFKARNHSMRVYNQTVKIYRILYNKTMTKYVEVNRRVMNLYITIARHELTQKYLHHARRYYGHSKKIVEARVRHFHHLKRYWQRRISHRLNHAKNVLNPVNWIPPYNSTAMIFGNPHVYTFDSKYFRFPGYNNERCTYVLARDTRDNKFTLMSQESALILVTEDANVKIHSDGRVETMTKINAEGEKISDGYDNELPVETSNTTVSREGPYIVLRHTLGLEILCDVEHYLCTFNIARWYHGRLAGLLGTNNNEDHDEMLMPNNKITDKVTQFINSWEVSKDEDCKITKEYKPKPKCKVSTRIHRCGELFKSLQSPLARFFEIIDPKPFLKACENDYADCDSNTPKDMKHCNVTAAYVELLKMKGQWVEYLPECGRCENHEMGRTWFQSGKNAVDIVFIVPESQGMSGFASKISSYITELQRDLSKYSFRFGLVGFGGKGIHQSPHPVTMNGQFIGKAEELAYALEHLKFANTLDNETDGFQAIAQATKLPFRTGSTKIFYLLTTSERVAHPSSPCVRRMTKKLRMRDITLNIIGKYQKFNGEVMGQDYLGKVFYRKMPRGSSTGVALPDGEYVKLMKNTKGSVFGMTFFASDIEKKSDAFRISSVEVLREQIKRDQQICKECFCARGLVGEGRSICKVNEHHKC